MVLSWQVCCGTVKATPSSLVQRLWLLSHTSFTINEVQRPHLPRWKQDTEDMRPSLKLIYRFHTSFIKIRCRGHAFFTKTVDTENTSLSLEPRHNDHTSFTRTDKYWGNAFFTETIDTKNKNVFFSGIDKYESHISNTSYALIGIKDKSPPLAIAPPLGLGQIYDPLTGNDPCRLHLLHGNWSTVITPRYVSKLSKLLVEDWKCTINIGMMYLGLVIIKDDLKPERKRKYRCARWVEVDKEYTFVQWVKLCSTSTRPAYKYSIVTVWQDQHARMWNWQLQVLQGGA